MSTDVIKNNCDRWIEYAYGVWLVWLRQTKPDQYYLRESTQILVNRMRNAVAERLNEEAWNLLERLKKLGTSIHGMRNDFGGDGFLYEQAEINLECAVVACRMGDDQEAGALLDMTSGSFGGRSVHKAVTCWIAGCIQWQSQSHFDTALVNWEKSCRIMTELGGNNTFDATFADECGEIASVMRNAIREASILGFPTPPPGGAGTRPNPGNQPGATPSPNPGPSPRPRNPGGNPGYLTARIRTFPIIGGIPAGSPIGIVDDSEDAAVIDGIEINGYYYKIYSLIEGHEINANQNSRYFILKVNGDSMNNALPVKIENGDYVLMVKQDTAETGEIVAAEINREDHEATLKRYSFKNGEYALSPESRNPANIHLAYKKDFYIRGKAIAVLKRDG
jgi:SOS-response transcriptional repressor LexA